MGNGGRLWSDTPIVGRWQAQFYQFTYPTIGWYWNGYYLYCHGNAVPVRCIRLGYRLPY